jgi:hypothetical protein
MAALRTIARGIRAPRARRCDCFATVITIGQNTHEK